MIESLLPDQFSHLAATILIVASFFTSALTAAAGIGGGLLMLALMTYLIPVSVIIPIHGLVQLGSNASRTWVQWENINWRITRIFLAGSLFGAILGILLAVQLPDGYLQAFLGIFILVMLWLKFPALRNASTSIVSMGGFSTTFVSMFAGATGPLVAVFLKNLFEHHKEMVATHAATMMVQHGIKVAAFVAAGFVIHEWLPLIGAMVVSGFLGIKAGTIIMNALPEKTLQIVFKITLTVVAADLVRQGLQIVFGS